ncbi:MAG: hypothetical protein K6C35_06015 [Eubacterium sp.]|nr:hypothetical protein [Eubacterium sp.]
MDRERVIYIVKEEIKKISGSNMEINENSILKNTGNHNIGLSSLETVQLLVELEGVFQIEFEEQLDKIADLVDYIIRHTEK